MQRLGVFATTAITAVTAQNLEGVSAVLGLDPSLVASQVQQVLSGFQPAAIKTGMLWSAGIIDRLVALLETYTGAIVVDPVMVATSGARLLAADAIKSYSRLFRLATVVTPNLERVHAWIEAEGLSLGREAARLV